MTASTLERTIWAGFAVGVLAVVVFGVISLRRSTPASSDLPPLGALPDFALTERSGKTVTRADLAGEPWVANFIFTQCSGVCPVLSTRMGKLRKALADNGFDNVRSVSISVDPTHDTPQVLSAYAQQYNADADRWLFLTGPTGDLYRLISEGFRLAVAQRSAEEATRTPGELITHSDRFVLVDGSGQLRAYYHGTDSAAVEQILADLRLLTST